MPDSVFFLPRERVLPVLLSEKGHFFVAEGGGKGVFPVSS